MKHLLSWIDVLPFSLFTMPVVGMDAIKDLLNEKKAVQDDVTNLIKGYYKAYSEGREVLGFEAIMN